MKRLRRLVLSLLVLVAALFGVSLYLADATFWNRAFTSTPLTFQGKGEEAAAPRVGKTSISLQGAVRGINGAPVHGVMVSASSGKGGYRVTDYTDGNGVFQMRAKLDGAVSLRFRAHGYEDFERVVPAGVIIVGGMTIDLKPLATADDKSEALAASSHAAHLKIADEGLRSAFVSQCHFCHQIGNSYTRAPREVETWTEIVDRMDGYLVMLTDAQKTAIRDLLSNTFTGNPVAAPDRPEKQNNLARARIEEWEAGDGKSFIHDADVGHDGRLYGVDEGHDVLWILDRTTGSVEKVAFPPSDLPVGGHFSGLALPIGIFTGKHGPHSLAQGKDGRFWITNALSSTLMSYHPETKAFESYAMGGDALYAHTIRIDQKGRVWFTLAASNQVARFVPDTKSFTVINLPSNGFVRLVSDLYLPLILRVSAWFPRSNLHLSLSHHKWFGIGKDALAMPYGIDIHPTDGSVWYAKLYANRIGRINPETLEITEWETPLKGPRRPRFDGNGTFWIPSFEDSALMAFDTASKAFRSFKLPLLAKGEYETPYALNVDRKTGHVWVTSNQSDRVFRFDPKAEKFTTYPLPTRVSFLRDLVFTEDGKVCSSQSNLPAFAIEGGVPSFICIDPDKSD